MAVYDPNAMKGLFAGLLSQPAAPAARGSNDPWNPNYMAGSTDPRDQLVRGIAQNQVVNKTFFTPQYQQAIAFALNDKFPQQEARRASMYAANTNILNRQQYLRMQERQQTATDPAVLAENERLRKFQDAKNIVGAYNTTLQGTKDYQMQTLGDIAGLGVASARQGLGLAVQAAGGAQNRATLGQQAKMQQQQAQQAQTMSAVSGTIGAIGAAASAYAALSALAIL